MELEKNKPASFDVVSTSYSFARKKQVTAEKKRHTQKEGKGFQNIMEKWKRPRMVFSSNFTTNFWEKLASLFFPRLP